MLKKSLAKIFSCSMALVFILSFTNLGAVALIEPGISEDNPILIKSKLDLEAFAQEVNDGNDYEGKFIKLANDIYLNSDETVEGKSIKWNPIGYYQLNHSNQKIYKESKPFNGTFDGNGYTINSVINKFEKQNDFINCASIFGFIGENGTVKNLKLRGLISDKNAESSVSALCDFNLGTIENCVSRSTVNGVYGASGLVQINGGIIKNCDINGKVFSKDFLCSGICSKNYGKISDCKVHALLANCKDNGINGDNFFKMPETAGVVAFNYGEVSNCNVDSYITNKNIETLSNYEYYLKQKSDGKQEFAGCAGGIVSTNNGLIENCKFTGNINSYEVGGIAGINYETIRNCESNCEILGAIAGGISAQNIVGDKNYCGEVVFENQGGLIENCDVKSTIKTFFLAGDIVCNQYWSDSRAVEKNNKSQVDMIIIK